MIKLIVAMDLADGIGKAGSIPWKAPTDMKRFRRLTVGCPVIVGRRTRESLPAAGLPGRELLMVGSGGFGSVEAAIDSKSGHDGDIWVGGGRRIYREAVERDLVDEIHITRIKAWHGCDTIMPWFVPWTYAADTQMLFGPRLWRVTKYELTDTPGEPTQAYIVAKRHPRG